MVALQQLMIIINYYLYKQCNAIYFNFHTLTLPCLIYIKSWIIDYDIIKNKCIGKITFTFESQLFLELVAIKLM